MSTPNFSKYNTRNYCVLLDENHCNDYEFMMDDLGYCAEDKGFDRTSDYNRSMEMSIFAERGGYENKYNTALTEIEMTAQLGVISGYYGIWKMNKKHVQTWLINLITKEYDACDKFCEENCDTRLYCKGVFSNGEAVYAVAN